MKELAPGIVVFENIFLESMKYIKRVQEEGLPWKAAEILVNDTENLGYANTNFRDTDVISLPHHESSETGILAEFTKEFHNNVNPCLNQYLEAYSAVVHKLEKPQLLRYGKNQQFHYHVDDHPFFTRRISLVYYLNDEYEGGDLEFSRQEVKVKAKKGDLLIFPANYMYQHKAHPVTDGIKYSVVQWAV
jgi:hypothetical protein